MSKMPEKLRIHTETNEVEENLYLGDYEWDTDSKPSISGFTEYVRSDLVPEWISTEAHLPDSAKPALVWDTVHGIMTLASYMGGDPVQDWKCLEDDRLILNVSYWMQPEPPVDVEEYDNSREQFNLPGVW